LSYIKLIQFERVEDLLATAQKMEIGAADRYMEYAETASTENPEIAALFSRLADEEREHEDNVVKLAKQASVDLSKVTVSDQTTSSEISQKKEQRKETLYEILAAAVLREEHAFDIYSQIAATSKNNEVRQYAEILAKEELGHAALLRAMRRRVYDEHKAQTRNLPGPDKVISLDEFLNTAYILEITLANYINGISDSGVEMSSAKEHSEFVINHLLDEIKKNSGVNTIVQPDNNMLPDTSIIDLDILMSECESVYEYFDSFILKTENEEIMNKALFLVSQTLTHLTLLQEIKSKLAKNGVKL
jgi:rubrerythrin